MDNIWIFTFGSGQENEGCCVRIEGTFDEARRKMVNRFGLNWGFQYSAEEWEEFKNDPKRFWPMEEEIYVKGLSYVEE